MVKEQQPSRTIVGSATGLPSRREKFAYQKRKAGHFKRNIWLLSIVVVILVALGVTTTFFYQPAKVLDTSMNPLIKSGDRVVLAKNEKIQRFDVVAFMLEGQPNMVFYQRVIGLPGDTIEIRKNNLYINGVYVSQPFQSQEPNRLIKTADYNMAAKSGQAKVPKGAYFLLGDDRVNAVDSRSWGFLAKQNIQGVVKGRFYPLNKIIWSDWK